MTRLKFACVVFVIFYIFLLPAAAKNIGDKIQPDNLFPQVKIETNVGNIIVELDRNRAPITANNFLTYVKLGSYNGTIFHRVVKDFVVQAGGYDVLFQERKQLSPIINESGNGLKNELYTIAMAREDNPHSATNQFYFNMADNDNLNPGKDWGYAVFGLVMEGTEALELINGALTDSNNPLGWNDVPKKQIVIDKITLIAEQ